MVGIRTAENKKKRQKSKLRPTLCLQICLGESYIKSCLGLCPAQEIRPKLCLGLCPGQEYVQNYVQDCVWKYVREHVKISNITSIRPPTLGGTRRVSDLTSKEESLPKHEYLKIAQHSLF